MANDSICIAEVTQVLTGCPRPKSAVMIAREAKITVAQAQSTLNVLKAAGKLVICHIKDTENNTFIDYYDLKETVDNSKK